MIAYIRGAVEFNSDGYIIIEACGVGYGAFVSGRSAAAVKTGEEIKLFTYEQTREDGRSLYGFLSRDELDMFSLLITVTGVGPKAALAILNAMRPKEINLAILTEDLSAFIKAPGIGKKTSQMIILKLKDKIKADEADAVMAAQLSVTEPGDAKRESVEALITLGYSKSEALKAVLESALPEMKTEQIIKLALRKLNRQGSFNG